MMKECPCCGKLWTEEYKYCPKDNYPLKETELEYLPPEENITPVTPTPYAFSEPIQQTQQNIPKCPTCGSTNIKKISDVKKATRALTFGLFSATARSQFECLNCHYKW